MPDVAFLGMRATNDFTVEGQRPKNWREALLRLYPNGKAPLTALTSLMKSESTDDPEYNWFCKILPTQAADVWGLFKNKELTDGAIETNVGSVLYVKMSEANARQFIPSHTVLLRNQDDTTYDTVAIVEEVVLAGNNSYLRVKLLEPGHGGSWANNKITRVLIIGTANAEGALIGQAVSYDPYKVHNYTQIFRNALEITRTADKTYLRTGPAYKEAKREALELHSIEMEKAFIFGVPSENTGGNGKPLRTTGGLIWAIKNLGGLVDTFPNNVWLDDGLDWLDEKFVQLFRYGETDKLAFVGDGALMAINKLARKHGEWQYTVSTQAFGINITELVTPFGQLTMKTHPLFSHEPTNQHSMLIFEPKNIKYRYITDTTFHADKMEHGHNRYDGKKEEYLTECGLEFHFPQGWAWLNNIGLDKQQD